jgi:predicted kinase
MNRTLHMTVGIVGSGKSTFVQKLQSQTNAAVVCPDDIRAELSGDASDQSKNGYIFTKVVPERIKAGLAVGDVIYDATNYNRKNRRDVCILAKSLGAKVVAHVFRTPHDECRRRNAGRSRVVPDFVIDRQIQGYEEPDKNIEKIDEVCEVR